METMSLWLDKLTFKMTNSINWLVMVY
jgi:hypothetical protein